MTEPGSPHSLLGGPTRVVGHRGAPTKALENTVESFDAAEAEGADAFELDVRLTFDGEVVVHHDADVVTDDGRFALSSLTTVELLSTPVRRGDFVGAVPTLRGVFDRFGGSARYLVEMKTGPAPRPGLLEYRVAALLTQYHLLGKALVLSFSYDMLRRIKEIQPEIETCLDFDGSAHRPEGRLWPELPKGCRAIAPNASVVSDRLFSEAAAAGLSVYVWTVNEPEAAKSFAERGASGVVTDVPDLVGPAIRAVTGRRSAAEIFAAF